MMASRLGIAFATLTIASSGRIVAQTAAPSDTPQHSAVAPLTVDVRLRTSGALRGEVVDSNAHAFVLVREKTPFVFSWRELEPDSALDVRRRLLAAQHSDRKLIAQEYYDLGMFALSLDRTDLAVLEFREATRISNEFQGPVRLAFAEHRKKKASTGSGDLKERREGDPAQGMDEGTNGDQQTVGSLSPPAQGLGHPSVSVTTQGLGHPSQGELELQWELSGDSGSAPRREQVMEKYRRFGAKVQGAFGTDVALIESEHFLIWTDWPVRDRQRLVELFEQMYSAVRSEFGVPDDAQVFLAKCPVFCWRGKARFQRFARRFDGYDAADAVGYTRSVEKTGHVHMVLVRPGKSKVDDDRFACTLVHEGTHAFLHRLFSTRLIPGWVNEGFAEMMVERVLGERSETGEKAALLAKEYARFDWPIGDMLERGGPIEVHQYALAQSIVTYLADRNRAKLIAFIKGLKQGSSVREALAEAFEGLTAEQLEADWKLANIAGVVGRY